MHRKYKMIDNIATDNGPLRLDGAPHATEEELSIFQNTNSVYDVVRLKPLGHLVAHIVIQEKKI